MSWLYERRDQLDGLRPFVEIAYHLTYGIPPYDRDDVEQDVVISLLRVSQRRDDPAYLWGVARKEVKKYWYKKCYYQAKFRYLREGEEFVSRDRDSDARLDAIAILATLPERLVRLGHDRLNGKKLGAADQRYWQRHKAKLDCRRNGREVSDWEKRRILRLHDEGLSVYQIIKTTGRHRATIKQCLDRE